MRANHHVVTRRRHHLHEEIGIQEEKHANKTKKKGRQGEKKMRL